MEAKWDPNLVEDVPRSLQERSRKRVEKCVGKCVKMCSFLESLFGVILPFLPSWSNGVPQGHTWALSGAENGVKIGCRRHFPVPRCP